MISNLLRQLQQPTAARAASLAAMDSNSIKRCNYHQTNKPPLKSKPKTGHVAWMAFETTIKRQTSGQQIRDLAKYSYIKEECGNKLPNKTLSQGSE